MLKVIDTVFPPQILSHVRLGPSREECRNRQDLGTLAIVQTASGFPTCLGSTACITTMHRPATFTYSRLPQLPHTFSKQNESHE